MYFKSLKMEKNVWLSSMKWYTFKVYFSNLKDKVRLFIDQAILQTECIKMHTNINLMPNANGHLPHKKTFYCSIQINRPYITGVQWACCSADANDLEADRLTAEKIIVLNFASHSKLQWEPANKLDTNNVGESTYQYWLV